MNIAMFHLEFMTYSPLIFPLIYYLSKLKPTYKAHFDLSTCYFSVSGLC